MSNTIQVEAVPVRSLASLSPNSPTILKSDYVGTPTAVPVIPVTQAPVVTQPVTVIAVESSSASGGGYKSGPGCWGGILAVFVVVLIVAFFLLYALNPTYVQNVNADGTPSGTVNVGKAVIAAIIFAVIAALIFWAFCACNR